MRRCCLINEVEQCRLSAYGHFVNRTRRTRVPVHVTGTAKTQRDCICRRGESDGRRAVIFHSGTIHPSSAPSLTELRGGGGGMRLGIRRRTRRARSYRNVVKSRVTRPDTSATREMTASACTNGDKPSDGVYVLTTRDTQPTTFITSAEEVMFSSELVCASVCQQDYAKIAQPIFTKFR